MTKQPFGPILRKLRRLVESNSIDDTSDGELLHRFHREGDEQSFTVLVRRHARLIHGTARRVLQDAEDAEDVVQATLLVLARKAGTLRRHESLTHWLHTIAFRIALRARAQRSRRFDQERQVAVMNAGVQTDNEAKEWNELKPILDEELQQLPVKYRSLVLLCDLAGRTQDQAARELGCPKGSVAKRLARGRELMRTRLIRRGVTLSAGWPMVLACSRAEAALSDFVLENKIRAALAYTAGAAPASTLLSAKVVTLAEGIMRTMMFTKLKALTLVVLACGLVGWAGISALGKGKGEPVGVEVNRDEEKLRVDLYGDPLPPGAIARLGTVRWRWYSGNISFSPDGKMLALPQGDHTISLMDSATGKELKVCKGHHGWVTSVAWSPDGKTLASGSMDCSVRLWDPATGSETHNFKGNKRGVFRLTWSPDSKKLASVNFNSEVRLWDPVKGMQLQFFNCNSNIPSEVCVAWSPDGKTLASASGDKTIRLWDPATGKELQVFKGHEQWISSLAWSPDGKTLASASNDNTIRLWDPATGKELQVCNGHESGVSCMAWSPDGKTLASASSGKTVRLWDPVTGKQLQVCFGHVQWVNSLAWSPDGKSLASTSGDRTVRLWDPVTGKELRICNGHKGVVSSVVWSPDGKTLASAGDDSTVRMWDQATGKELHVCKGHQGHVSSVAWSPDGKTLASAGHDETVRLWDPVTGKELRICNGHKGVVSSVSWSPDGRMLASGCGKVRVWDPATGDELLECNSQLVPPSPISSSITWVSSVSWSPSGKMLVSADNDGSVRFWDATSAKVIHVCNGHQRPVTFMAWSQDGKRVATASEDKSVRVWDSATGKELHVCIGHEGPVTSVTWSLDGKRLASAGFDRTVRFWEADTGKEIHIWNGLQSPVASVAWSPDGKTLAFSCYDRTVRVWEATTGKELHLFKGHQGPVTSVSWSPDGKSLASASHDTSVLIWSVWQSPFDETTVRLDAKDLEPCWADLAGEDAKKAWQAIMRLGRAPEQTLPWLRKHLRPTSTEPADKARTLLADLDSENFEVRVKAAKNVEELGQAILPELRKLLERNEISVEMRRRVERIVENLTVDVPTGDQLRSLRAVQVLERIRSKEAQEILQTLAAGAEGARLTEDAKAALARMKRSDSAGK